MKPSAPPSNEEALLPCPFCGSKAYLERDNAGGQYVYYVICSTCRCSTPSTPQLRIPTERWNARTALLQETPAPAIARELATLDEFAAWLVRQMPTQTVVADPGWWASRIYRAIVRDAAPQAPAPEKQEPEDVLVSEIRRMDRLAVIEECARVCERMAEKYDSDDACESCATAIRALAQEG